jgi:hypothetical protein
MGVFYSGEPVPVLSAFDALTTFVINAYSSRGHAICLWQIVGRRVRSEAEHFAPPIRRRGCATRPHRPAAVCGPRAWLPVAAF